MIALVSIVLPVAVVADTPAAAAVPEWAQELAQDAIETCLAIPEAVMGDGFASVAFVAPPASAGPHLIGVTGTGAGSAAATGGVVVTGAKAALAAGVFAGVFCGGIAVLDWMFGTKPVPTVPLEYATSTGLRECSDAPASGLWGDLGLQAEWDALAGRQPGDRCVTVHLDVPGALNNSQLFSAVRWIRPDPGSESGFRGTDWLPQRNVNGSLTPADVCTQPALWNSCGIASASDLLSQLRAPDREKQLVHVVMPCVAPEVKCGLLDVPDEAYPWQPGIRIGRSTYSAAGLVGNYPAFPEVIADGLPRRMRARLVCKRPGDGHEVIVESHSAMFWDSDEGPPLWQHEKCPSGYAPVEVDVWRQRARGGMHVPVTWTNDGPDDHVLGWTIDPRIRNNPTSLQCWLEGVTSCPIHQVDPANPDSDVEVGGQGGVRIPKPERDLRTATAPELLADVPWRESHPGQQPAPSTTTTTTTPTTTIAPPEDPENCEGAHCAGGPGVPPPESEGSECWPSGWGWLNPVEWVLRPIKCALMWAFWDQDSAEDMAALGSEHGWTQAVTQSSVTTDPAAGPCLQLDHGAEICTEPILAYEVPSFVQGLVAAVVLFFGLFEVIGLFARITGG